MRIVTSDNLQLTLPSGTSYVFRKGDRVGICPPITHYVSTLVEHLLQLVLSVHIRLYPHMLCMFIYYHGNGIGLHAYLYITSFSMQLHIG